MAVVILLGGGGGGLTRNAHKYSRWFLESGRLKYMIHWIPVLDGCWYSLVILWRLPRCYSSSDQW